MKWFTKRAQLTSNDKMYPALSRVLIGFIDKLKIEGKVKLWYTSLKTEDDGSRPSFRIYLQLEDVDEQYAQSKFMAFMNKNKAELGWTGQFIEPDPEPGTPPSYPHLHEINEACELVLKLTKQFPDPNRKMNNKFWNAIKSEFNKSLDSMTPEHHNEFRHFVANNLAMSDYSFTDVIHRTINLKI